MYTHKHTCNWMNTCNITYIHVHVRVSGYGYGFRLFGVWGLGFRGPCCARGRVLVLCVRRLSAESASGADLCSPGALASEPICEPLLHSRTLLSLLILGPLCTAVRERQRQVAAKHCRAMLRELCGCCGVRKAHRGTAPQRVSDAGFRHHGNHAPVLRTRARTHARTHARTQQKQHTSSVH